MSMDVPYFTEHEMRSTIYIRQVNLQKNQEKPCTIKQLVDNTGYTSRHYTRAWNRLQPRNIIKRTVDGKNTRLELTGKGKKAADKLMELNEVLEK